MPVWAPWDFSWLEYLATTLAVFWFFRGLMQEPSEMRPSCWRQIAFVSGLLVIYAALQTRFDYMAQHMFFLNRAQHVIMHHIGPSVAVLGWPGETIKQGMPRRLRSIVEHRGVSCCRRVRRRATSLCRTPRPASERWSAPRHRPVAN
ncbi:cytochrome c oxidase assembly protein [Enhydrobacter sp.]|uniref:cytochrome c oxidase assembly protein n=1 Tax=Enhydrobacter sp. TaxID=1894999 RepID=UPI00262CFCA6|nr:cytochrome c oxidase assembly protein [Enhydrobacter sp.]